MIRRSSFPTFKYYLPRQEEKDEHSEEQRGGVNTHHTTLRTPYLKPY